MDNENVLAPYIDSAIFHSKLFPGSKVLIMFDGVGYSVGAEGYYNAIKSCSPNLTIVATYLNGDKI